MNTTAGLRLSQAFMKAKGSSIALGDVPAEIDVHSMIWVGIATRAVVNASRQASTDYSIRKLITSIGSPNQSPETGTDLPSILICCRSDALRSNHSTSRRFA